MVVQFQHDPTGSPGGRPTADQSADEDVHPRQVGCIDQGKTSTSKLHFNEAVGPTIHVIRNAGPYLNHPFIAPKQPSRPAGHAQFDMLPQHVHVAAIPSLHVDEKQTGGRTRPNRDGHSCVAIHVGRLQAAIVRPNPPMQPTCRNGAPDRSSSRPSMVHHRPHPPRRPLSPILKPDHSAGRSDRSMTVWSLGGSGRWDGPCPCRSPSDLCIGPQRPW